MKRIHIIATGGTIAGRGKNIYDLANYVSGVVPINEIIAEIPGLNTIAEITTEDIFNIGSEDITKKHWLELAKKVNEAANNENTDGIVITHGTDTMEETAYFLNLVLNTPKPVVLTGAMLPTTAAQPDGPDNLKNAVMVAADNGALGQNVLVVMNHNIFSASGVRKTHASSVDAFADPVFFRLGYIDNNVNWLQKQNKQTLHFDVSQINDLPQVEILSVYADINVKIAENMLNANIKNIVFNCFGNGTLPKPLVDLIGKSNGFFVSTTQTGAGKAVHTYPNLICGNGLTAKQARIMLMLALTQTSDKNEISKYFK